MFNKIYKNPENIPPTTILIPYKLSWYIYQCKVPEQNESELSDVINIYSHIL